MNILFIAPVQSQVRYYKRIMALEELGAKCKLLFFERDYYEGKEWSIYHRSLGQMKHGNYFTRIKELLKALPLVRDEAQSTDIIYVFGLDMLLLAVVSNYLAYRKKIIVYELADLGVRTSNSLTSKVIRNLEKILIKFVDKIVLTSSGYYYGYFKNIVDLKKGKYLIIENKVEKSFPGIKKGESESGFNDDKLSIGYFGMLRSGSSFKILKKIAEKGGEDVKIILAGKFRGLDQEMINIKEYKNVEYLGTYVSPDELPKLYNCIDISWCALNLSNAQYMRTNRFYEACYYKKPLITHNRSLDGKLVDQYDIGLNIDMDKIEDTVNKVLNISEQDLKKWSENINKMPVSEYVYTDEHEKLFKFFKNVSV